MYDVRNSTSVNMSIISSPTGGLKYIYSTDFGHFILFQLWSKNVQYINMLLFGPRFVRWRPDRAQMRVDTALMQ